MGYLCQADFGVSEEIQIDNFKNNYKYAILATWDQFIDNKEKINELKNIADLVDMEWFAIAYLAKKYNKNVILIKSISDKADWSAQEHLFENLKKAMKNSVFLLKEFIESKTY